MINQYLEEKVFFESNHLGHLRPEKENSCTHRTRCLM